MVVSYHLSTYFAREYFVWFLRSHVGSELCEEPSAKPLNMKSTTLALAMFKTLLLCCGALLIAYFVYEVRSVIAYILFAVVVALIGRPIKSFLRRQLKLPHILAIALTLLLLVCVLGGIIALFVPLLAEQGENLRFLRLEDIQNELDEMARKVSRALGASPQVVEEIVKETDIETKVAKEIEVGFFTKMINSVMEILGTIGIGLFSVIFISFFFLKDGKLIQRIFVRIFPERHRHGVLNSMEGIKVLLSRYFVGLIIQMTVLFVIYAATLLLVGVENAVVIAFLCALFNIVPYVGPIFGGLIMMALTLTSNLGGNFGSEILRDLGFVAIGITIGQLVDNFFSQPLIFSNSVKSHPLEIFLIIIIAGMLFGVFGMIVAVPAYTVLKVLLKEFVPNNEFVRTFTNGM